MKSFHVQTLIKDAESLVRLINQECLMLAGLTDDELRTESELLRTNIKKQIVKEKETSIHILQKQLGTISMYDHIQRIKISEEINRIKEEKDPEILKSIGKIMDTALPRAFAVLAETVRRFKENHRLNVKAQPTDIMAAERDGNCHIEGDRAVWENTRVVDGEKIICDWTYTDHQLLKGVILHHGIIVESPGEKEKYKELILDVFLGALSGREVHVMDSDQAKARKNMLYIRPFLEFHGLPAISIDHNKKGQPEGKDADDACVVFGTAEQFIFSFLQNMTCIKHEELTQNHYYHACFFDADRSLLEPASVPYTIKGPLPENEQNLSKAMKNVVHDMVKEQVAQVEKWLNQFNDTKLKEDIDETCRILCVVEHALPAKQATEYLFHHNIISDTMRNTYDGCRKRFVQDTENNLKELFFYFDKENSSVFVTQKGKDFICKGMFIPGFLTIPDIVSEYRKIEEKNLEIEKEAILKDQILESVKEKEKRWNTLYSLLWFHVVFENEIRVETAHDNIEIHLLSSGKNSDQYLLNQTYASIASPNYFKKYSKISGLTDTAGKRSGEFRYLYDLNVLNNAQISSTLDFVPGKSCNGNDLYSNRRDEKDLSDIKSIVDADMAIHIPRENVLSLRKKVLCREQISVIIRDMLLETINDFVESYLRNHDPRGLKCNLIKWLSVKINGEVSFTSQQQSEFVTSVYNAAYDRVFNNPANIATQIRDVAKHLRENNEKKYENIAVSLTSEKIKFSLILDLQKTAKEDITELSDSIRAEIILNSIDKYWRQFIRNFEYLHRSCCRPTTVNEKNARIQEGLQKKLEGESLLLYDRMMKEISRNAIFDMISCKISK